MSLVGGLPVVRNRTFVVTGVAVVAVLGTMGFLGDGSPFGSAPRADELDVADVVLQTAPSGFRDDGRVEDRLKLPSELRRDLSTASSLRAGSSRPDRGGGGTGGDGGNGPPGSGGGSGSGGSDSGGGNGSGGGGGSGGLLPLPDLPEELPLPDLPDVPEIPLPDVPEIPLPDVPGLPLPDVPGIPLPDLPGIPLPDLPDVPLPELPDLPLP